jgi:glyceraldehyde 3-phosphate dehydrogenase
MRIGINGFGRIGRSVFRILDPMPGVEVVAINDITDNDALAYLLKHDTVMGPFHGKIEVDGDVMRAGKQTVKMTEIPNPAELPWGALGVDFVIESTGRFRKRSEIEQHLAAGARKVILTVPAKDEIDCTVVLGVNEADLKREHRIVSNASCTTNCLAPMAKVLHENFGIVSGVMTTVHAYTNDQRLADVPHSDWRRSRAAAERRQGRGQGAAGAGRQARRPGDARAHSRWLDRRPRHGAHRQGDRPGDQRRHARGGQERGLPQHPQVLGRSHRLLGHRRRSAFVHL